MKKITSLLLGVLLLFTFNSNAQDPPQYGTPFSGVPDPRDVNIYQVHIRPYSAAGNFAGVTARLDAIKALGINVVYLMPFYPHGTDSRSSNSPYSIKDFKSVASEYGSLADLRTLVDGAHSRGMAVMMDFAVNGTSWDHPWITQHPDWYNQSGGVIQQLATFPDVAGLNFGNSSMRAAIVDAMRYWIFAANIDGYRCDFANNPPLDFWTNTINNLRGITSHKLLMFAEGDRPENFQTGFDLNFGDKWYYDAIKPIRNGTSVAQIQTTTNTEYGFANSTQQVVRYLSNHDVETFETAMNVFGGHNGVIANYLVSAYMRGVPFLTSGQEVDFNQTIPWPYTSVKINWGINPGAAADFTKVLNFRNNSNAIRRGTMTNYSNTNVCAFTKIAGSDKVVVMVNLRSGTSTFTIPAAMAGTYKDAYSTSNITLTSGATQTLGAFQYIVLTNVACTPTAITPYLTINGGAWTQTASATLNSGGSVTFGPQPLTGGTWSWSGPNGYSSSVREISFSNVQTTQSGSYVATHINSAGCASTQTFTLTVNPPPSNLPSPWVSSNIGAVGADGSASHSSGTFTVNASGADVFDFADEFRYIYQPFSGNVTVTVRLASLTNTNAWAKAGVMIRESLAANSSNAAMLLTSSNGFNFQYRNGTGAGSTAAGNAGGGIPNWVRITRSGNTLTGYSSTNGTGWTQTGTVTITMTASVYIGFFATSHNDGTLTTATFTNVSVTSGAPDPAPTYYTIRNRWTNAYLYDAGGNVGYGSTVANNNYKWEKVAVDATYFRWKNLGTGEYMHIENQTGSVQCTGVTLDWWSGQWSQESVDATWVRFRNRWQTGSIIHVESQTGSAQYAGGQDGWYSAHWQLSTTSSSRMATEELETVDIIQDKEPSMEIFPNPAQGKTVNITLTGIEPGEAFTLTVYDMQGRAVSTRKMGSSGTFRYTIPVAGIYLVQLSNDKVNIRKQIVVQ